MEVPVRSRLRVRVKALPPIAEGLLSVWFLVDYGLVEWIFLALREKEFIFISEIINSAGAYAQKTIQLYQPGQ